MPVRLNSSGGGSVTLDVPAVGTTTTLNLPTANGTLLASDGSGNVTVSGAATFSGNATFNAGLIPSSSFLRNRIINGDMRIDQRNAGAAVTVNSGGQFFTVDRFYAQAQGGGVFTIQQSTTAPTGFTNSIIATVTTPDTSIAGTDFYAIKQRVEGFNCADFGWGAAGAQTVTLSFWARSSITGTYTGALINSAENRSYPFSYTISAANTFEYKTVTIAGDTTGTWVTNNGTGISVGFALGVGSTYLGAAGAWSGSRLEGATGQTQWISTNGATFYLTGVQLEVGSVATPFERRQFGQELALCQRYCFVLNQNGVATGVWGGLYSSTAGRMWTKLPVTMRANPSLSNTSNTNTFEMLSVAITSGTLTNFASSRDYITFDAVSLGVSSVIGLPLCYIGPGTISAEL